MHLNVDLWANCVSFGPNSFGPTWAGFCLTLAVICILVGLCTVVRRIFFHPLSGFPGPWIAASSQWFEFYYDVVRGGKFSQVYHGLHVKYESNIVRIGPNHLHISDPEFYHEYETVAVGFLKSESFYETFGSTDSLVAIVDPRTSRIRRKAVASIFSQAGLTDIAPAIWDKILLTGSILRGNLETQSALNIQKIYHCLTVDVICELLFGTCPNLSAMEEENPDILRTLDTVTTSVWLFKHFPSLAQLALKLPPCISEIIVPGYVAFRRQCENAVQDLLKQASFQDDTKRGDRHRKPTIFRLLLESPDARNTYNGASGLADEAFGFLIGGTDTTTMSLAYVTYFLLTSPRKLSKLREELDPATPYIKDGDWRRIQRLPYLGAVIKETLRLSSVVPGVLPRTVPADGVFIHDQFIPGGSCVSLSSHIIHNDPHIFPDPTTFIPERWLGEAGKTNERWNLAFSKGPRRCIGSSLAYLELHLCIAYYFNRFDMELSGITASSMEWSDYVIKSTRMPVKVKVLLDRWAE